MDTGSLNGTGNNVSLFSFSIIDLSHFVAKRELNSDSLQLTNFSEHSVRQQIITHIIFHWIIVPGA